MREAPTVRKELPQPTVLTGQARNPLQRNPHQGGWLLLRARVLNGANATADVPVPHPLKPNLANAHAYFGKLRISGTAVIR
jgi:hypothetical protein